MYLKYLSGSESYRVLRETSPWFTLDLCARPCDPQRSLGPNKFANGGILTFAILVLVLFLPLTGYVTSFYLAYQEDCLFNTMSLCVNVRNVLIAIPVLADTGYIHGNRRNFISTRTRSTERK